MNMFEGCLVILSTIFQPTHVYFCSFQYLTLRRREVGKVIKAGAHFFLKRKLYSWSKTRRIYSSFKWELILQLIYSCARDQSTVICPGLWMHRITTERGSETSIFSCIPTTFGAHSQQSPQAWQGLEVSTPVPIPSNAPRSRCTKSMV